MGKAVFKIDEDFKAMVAHAQKTKTGISLAKDQGLYLCTNGRMVKGKVANLVVYANGCNPNTDEFDEWYDKAHRIAGGDDFGEAIDVPFLAKAIMRGVPSVWIHINRNSIRLEA